MEAESGTLPLSTEKGKFFHYHWYATGPGCCYQLTSLSFTELTGQSSNIIFMLLKERSWIHEKTKILTSGNLMTDWIFLLFTLILGIR